ncbi:hypothetical protein P7K49_036949, partial [Saguinus oedipus]
MKHVCWVLDSGSLAQQKDGAHRHPHGGRAVPTPSVTVFGHVVTCFDHRDMSSGLEYTGTAAPCP